MRRSSFGKLLSFVFVVSIIWSLFRSDISWGQDKSSRNTWTLNMENIPKWQIDAKTFGGRQFWGDVQFFQGYRIQQNVLTKHYRLLDPGDVRRSWGTFEDCQEKLNAIAQEKQLPAMTGKCVILIHGIARSSKSMKPMAKALEEAGYTVVNFEYPSTRVTMAESAEYLQQTISSLEGIEEINFVCWSMGGLLVRTYIDQHAEDRDDRIHRMVMMGSPNQGAEMANLLRGNFAFKLIMGPAGQELVADENGTIAKLPVPDFEFAVIAGARGTKNGWNPLIPGDDDGTVSVESTKLPGARDFMTVTALHSFISHNDEAIESVKRFLQTGVFRENGERNPIEPDTAEQLENEQ